MDFRRVSKEKALIEDLQVIHDFFTEHANKRIIISDVDSLSNLSEHLFNYLFTFVLFDARDGHGHRLSPVEGMSQD
jgi:hypothetical protein